MKGQVKRFGLRERERERERDPFSNGLSSFDREMSGCRCLEKCVVVGVQKNV